MKYLLLSFLLLMILDGCSRKPGTYNTPQPKSKHTQTQHKTQASPTPKNTTASTPSTLDKLHQQHRQWKGTPYQYGGMSKSGVDCSGFVHRTYQRLFNIKLPRSTKDQVKMGKRVYLNQLKAGDLVFFKTGWNVRHVGIYLEKGKFLHASSSHGVIISTMYSGYWKEKYWQARRLI